MSHIVLGTAGHIDHGKTSLVRALTGRDTDTLREEQERKITIDLGFAHLGDLATIIDVPGHERFIKNMVTGVATVDFILLVVAADDGIMPQTREHLDILRLLGVEQGMIVLTKTALAEEDWIELVCEELREFTAGTFLENAPLHRVDSLSGLGIPELKQDLEGTIAALPDRRRKGIFRLFVDRSFSVRGHGTVCTGTVLSGQLALGDEVEVLPAGLRARARGLQVHGEACETVTSGDRAALNLQGVHREDVARGDCLAAPGILRSSRLLDVDLSLLADSPRLEMRDRVRLHIGTSEVMARVVLLGRENLDPGTSGLVQLRLEEEVCALRGDRFVIRRYSPARTIGGGEVVDPSPPRHRPHASKAHELLGPAADLQALPGLMRTARQALWKRKDFQARTGLPLEDLQALLAEFVTREELVAPGEDCWIEAGRWKQLRDSLLGCLEDYHRDFPEQEAMPLAELRSRSRLGEEGRLFDLLLEDLAEEITLRQGEVIRKGHEARISPALRSRMDRLLGVLEKRALPPPRPPDLARELEVSATELRRLFKLCEREGLLVCLSPEVSVLPSHLEELISSLRALAEGLPGGAFTVSQAGQRLDSPRRFTVPLLEYTDSRGLTARQGDERIFVDK